MVTALAWHPGTHSLLMVAKDGQFAFWEDILEPKLFLMGGPTEASKFVEKLESVNKLIDDEADEDSKADGQGDDGDDDDDEDDDDDDDLNGSFPHDPSLCPSSWTRSLI